MKLERIFLRPAKCHQLAFKTNFQRLFLFKNLVSVFFSIKLFHFVKKYINNIMNAVNRRFLPVPLWTSQNCT